MNNYRLVYILANQTNSGWVMLDGSGEFPNRATAKAFFKEWEGDKTNVHLVRKEVSFFVDTCLD